MAVTRRGCSERYHSSNATRPVPSIVTASHDPPRMQSRRRDEVIITAALGRVRSLGSAHPSSPTRCSSTWGGAATRLWP
jgi:hypothetical protein